MFTAVLSGALFLRLIWAWTSNGYVPPMTALALAFFTITTLNATFFAFWMDKEANDDLNVRMHRRATAPELVAAVPDPGPPPTNATVDLRAPQLCSSCLSSDLPSPQAGRENVHTHDLAVD